VGDLLQPLHLPLGFALMNLKSLAQLVALRHSISCGMASKACCSAEYRS
jgi:hypothetical protein